MRPPSRWTTSRSPRATRAPSARPSRSRCAGQRSDRQRRLLDARRDGVLPGGLHGPGGSLVFLPGQTTQTFTVLVNDDVLDEIDENFTVHLSNPVNAIIEDGIGLGTITRQRPLPTLAIDNVTVAEGNSGTVNATFTVGLNTPSGRAALGRLRNGGQLGDRTGATTRRRAEPWTSPPARPRRRSPSSSTATCSTRSTRQFLVNLSNPLNATLQRLSRRRDDHRRRPGSRRSRSVTRRSPRATRAPSTRPSPSRSRAVSGRPVIVQLRDGRRQRDSRRGLRRDRARDADLRWPARRRRRSRCRCTATCSTRSTRPSRSISRAERARRSPTAPGQGTITDDDALPRRSLSTT